MSKIKKIPQGAVAMLERGFVWKHNAQRWAKWYSKLFRVFDSAEEAEANMKNKSNLAIIIAGKHGQNIVGYAVYQDCLLPKNFAQREERRILRPSYVKKIG
jgi:hypothetical protein